MSFDRRIEELQQEISESSQKVSKLSDELSQTKEETDDQINKLEEKQEEERAGNKKQTENLVSRFNLSLSLLMFLRSIDLFILLSWFTPAYDDALTLLGG